MPHVELNEFYQWAEASTPIVLLRECWALMIRLVETAAYYLLLLTIDIALEIRDLYRHHKHQLCPLWTSFHQRLSKLTRCKAHDASSISPTPVDSRNLQQSKNKNCNGGGDGNQSAAEAGGKRAKLPKAYSPPPPTPKPPVAAESKKYHQSQQEQRANSKLQCKLVVPIRDEEILLRVKEICNKLVQLNGHYADFFVPEQELNITLIRFQLDSVDSIPRAMDLIREALTLLQPEIEFQPFLTAAIQGLFYTKGKLLYAGVAYSNNARHCPLRKFIDRLKHSFKMADAGFATGHNKITLMPTYDENFGWIKLPLVSLPTEDSMRRCIRFTRSEEDFKSLRNDRFMFGNVIIKSLMLVSDDDGVRGPPDSAGSSRGGEGGFAFTIPLQVQMPKPPQPKSATAMLMLRVRHQKSAALEFKVFDAVKSFYDVVRRQDGGVLSPFLCDLSSLHITLGCVEVNLGNQEIVCQAIRRAARRFSTAYSGLVQKRLKVAIQGVYSFPTKHSTLYAALGEGKADVRRLCELLVMELSASGLALMKVPDELHVTLVRIKKGEGMPSGKLHFPDLCNPQLPFDAETFKSIHLCAGEAWNGPFLRKDFYHVLHIIPLFGEEKKKESSGPLDHRTLNNETPLALRPPSSASASISSSSQSDAVVEDPQVAQHAATATYLESSSSKEFLLAGLPAAVISRK